jgi:hypothetical protein
MFEPERQAQGDAVGRLRTSPRYKRQFCLFVLASHARSRFQPKREGTNRARQHRPGLFCAAAGCVGRAFGRKEPIERKIHGAKSREPTLNQRDTDHCRE